MDTSITVQDLTARLREIAPLIEAYEKAQKSGQAVEPPAALAERKQILDKIRAQRVGFSENMKTLQWDAHHFAEDCLATASTSENGAYVGELIEALIRFRDEYRIQSCNACR